MPKMVKFLPYETIQLTIEDPVGTVRERLATQVEPFKLIRWGRDHLPYMGQVLDARFEVRRIIHYRNSFLPQITGQFTPIESGTVVKMTFQLNPLVIAFLAVWCGLWFMGAVPLSWFAAITGETHWALALLLTVMPMVVLGAFSVAFRYEVNRSCQELSDIMLGQF